MALRPQVLEGNDLPTALREMVTGMTMAHRSIPICAGWCSAGAPTSVDENLLAEGQEALTNAISVTGAPGAS